MSARALAWVHNSQVELQALQTRRCAMVAANHMNELRNEPPTYTEEHFDALAAEIRTSCWVDHTNLPE